MRVASRRRRERRKEEEVGGWGCWRCAAVAALTGPGDAAAGVAVWLKGAAAGSGGGGGGERGDGGGGGGGGGVGGFALSAVASLWEAPMRSSLSGTGEQFGNCGRGVGGGGPGRERGESPFSRRGAPSSGAQPSSSGGGGGGGGGGAARGKMGEQQEQEEGVRRGRGWRWRSPLGVLPGDRIEYVQDEGLCSAGDPGHFGETLSYYSLCYLILDLESVLVIEA